MRACIAIGLLTVAMATGCGPAGRKDLVPVRGTVRFNASPLATGSVSFRPDPGKQNRTLDHPTGSIDSQGRYQLFTSGSPGAPPGSYLVIVNATEPTGDSGRVSPGMPKSIIPVRYNSPATTPLKMEVKAGAPAGHYDLDLEGGGDSNEAQVD